MNELSVDDYENGLRRLSVLVRRMTEEGNVSVGGSVRQDNMVCRNVCVVCRYTWENNPEKPVPVRCPSCKSERWNAKDLRHHVCRSCGHKWMSRKEHPLRCPACRSKLWCEDVRKCKCSDCGFEQDYRMDRKAPDRCPVCDSGNWSFDYMSCLCKRCGFVGLVPSGERSRCPICRSTMSSYNVGDTKADVKAKAPGMTEDMCRHLIAMSDDEFSCLTYLTEHGFDHEDASIIVCYLRGDNEISIARDQDVSVSRVISLTGEIRSYSIGRPAA